MVQEIIEIPVLDLEYIWNAQPESSQRLGAARCCPGSILNKPRREQIIIGYFSEAYTVFLKNKENRRRISCVRIQLAPLQGSGC